MSQHVLSLGSNATIQVLLVPVQPVKRTSYAQLAALIRNFTRIRLRDVPTDPRGPAAAPLSASPTASGSLLFNYVDVYSRSQAYLYEFQLSRRTLGIIGIVDCAEWDDLEEAQQEFQRLLGQHPTVLATRCYAFNPQDGQNDNVDGLVVIPNVGDMHFYVATLLADFAASVLHGLSDVVRHTSFTFSNPLINAAGLSSRP